MAEIMGRRERKKLQSKNTILSAAVKEFTEKGVRETSIADIMNEAELGIGTFYNYFESKEALLFSLLGKITEDVREEAEKMIEEENDAPTIIKKVMDKTAEALDENRFVLPLFLSAADEAAKSARKTELLSPPAPKFSTVFNGIIEYGQRRGEFDDGVPAPVVTEMFHSIFQAASFSSLSYTFKENIDMKTGLILSGLAPKKL